MSESHLSQQQQPPSQETERVVQALAGVTDTDTQAGAESGEPSPVVNRRPGSRVHWDSAGAGVDGGRAHDHISADRRLPTDTQGPNVTIRGTSGGFNRPNHPGPLNLSSRLDQGSIQGLTTTDGTEAAPDASSQAVIADPAQLNLTGAKGLDNEGLDNRAFLELQRELQRHEAQDDTHNGDSWPAGRSSALEDALQTHAKSRAEQRRAYRRPGNDTPDWATSGTSTPGEYTSDSGSYDAAADSDLDHIDFMAGEVDGMPSKQKRKKEEVAAEEPRGWAKLRGLMGIAKSPPVDAEAQEKLPHEAGGPTNLKSVPVTTSTGTRQGPRSRPNKFEREAAKLVRAHKLMTGQSDPSESSNAPGIANRMPSISRRHLDSEASTPDPLETAARMDARPVPSGGVLGNLLKLYEQQQQEERSKARSSGMSTADGTSMASTPDRDLPAGRDDLSESIADGLREENEKASLSGAAPVVPPSGAAGANRRPIFDNRKSWAPSASSGVGWARDGGSKFATATGTAAIKTFKTVANEAGFDDVADERPKAARSGAGVVGGLIATTGNLIGAVSPHHAQLGPNPKRPGYTLDRYLLPEMNAKTLKRTQEALATAASRPTRRSHSQPGTPGVRSPPSMTDKTAGGSGTGPSTPNEKKPRSIYAPTHSRKHSSKMLHLAGNKLHGMKAWSTNSAMNTPDPNSALDQGDYFGNAEDDERLAKQEWQKKLKKRSKDKRRKEEIFITMHVAAILQRQEFLLKLSRALMMFGAPTHRIETQIQQTARVLEINCRCIYLPNLMLFAFGDDATHTSETKFIKQGGGIDFTKLTDMHTIYWNVIHDKIGVAEASAQLDELMRRKPLIGRWPMVIIGGFCSSFICVGPMGFNGSFIDAVLAFPLGAFLVYCQSIITTELFSNVFEIVFAALNSFIAAAVSSTPVFCYAGVVSGSIVLILPGFIVLSGSLELQSKNLVAGSVRLVYAIIYSLFLGFGLSIGSSFWALFSGGSNEGNVTVCTTKHDDSIWWRANVPLIWALLTVPMYATCLSLRNQAKINRKEFPAMVIIACAGWACNHFAATAEALSGRQDITSALGSLAVGLLSNAYGRIFDGRSYVVAVTGVLYQLPSGLSNGGLLNFAETKNNTDNFNSGFTVAQSLVETALGLTVGLFASTIIAYVLGGRKQRVGGLFSF
ncbi:unnamed protein product [Sympodiomycopsis kandeliae]